MAVTLHAGSWTITCEPDDGARLIRLAVEGRDLLTGPPVEFRAPRTHPGRYETRPVYGYDDCFPTVDPCADPVDGRAIADHGLLCWIPWQVSADGHALRAHIDLPGTALRFERSLNVHGRTLQWVFRVINGADTARRFLHVMHGLMPITELRALELPPCTEVVDETTGRAACEPPHTAAWLLDRPAQSAEMILMRGVESGTAALHWAGGGTLRIRFDPRLFPTLAIWWNRGGFPAEAGLRRWECAFEPMAGPWSSLARSAAEGQTQVVPPQSELEWSIDWEWEDTESCR